MTGKSGCVLCAGPGGRLVIEAPKFRVIHAEEAGFPAFYRVVWRDHVAEFSDLDAADRAHCMDAVTTVEQCLRDLLVPTKINLAALGNMVPHLHWHVIARFDWDSHFPAPVWAGATRERDEAREAAVLAKLPTVEAAIAARLQPKRN
ncbi:HIT family protein [Variovorax sp. RHLX14]|uniref:HIT family protein n=1 Tax=Variovorax sp. RHLX14 TaxID=1259731 RepID=UPI003F485E9D